MGSTRAAMAAEVTTFCPQCGAPQEPNTTFCPNCGAEQPTNVSPSVVVPIQIPEAQPINWTDPAELRLSTKLKDLYALFGWVDQDASKSVNLSEFANCLHQIPALSHLTQDQVKSLFAIFDFNSNGAIDREEFSFVVATQLFASGSSAMDAFTLVCGDIMDRQAKTTEPIGPGRS